MAFLILGPFSVTELLFAVGANSVMFALYKLMGGFRGQ